MRAALITGHGGNEVVAVADRPIPPRAPGEVPVRVMAATLNRVDLYMRDSGAGITHRLPQIRGLDGAGLVEEIDAGGEHRDGTLAQFVSVPARNVFPMPPDLGFEQAAARGVNHLTAWRMLFNKARIMRSTEPARTSPRSCRSSAPRWAICTR